MKPSTSAISKIESRRLLSHILATITALLLLGCGGGASTVEIDSKIWGAPENARTEVPDIFETKKRRGIPITPTDASTRLQHIEMLFNWAESIFPQYFPINSSTLKEGPWFYRAYFATGIMVGVNGIEVFVMGGPFGPQPIRVGVLSDFIPAPGNTNNYIESTWPQNESINVGLDTSISISLTKTPDYTTITRENITVTENGLGVATKLDFNNNGIIITPLEKLKPGKTYIVSARNIKDPAGRSLIADFKFSFNTTPGRFSEPQRLVGEAGINAHSVATGDINGDGFSDIVYTHGQYPHDLLIRTGRDGNVLNNPIKVDTGPLKGSSESGYCDLVALAIGDVTNDGRPDIVVGSMTCGIQVIKQTETNGWELGEFIRTPVHALKTVDMNNDGRLDIIGINNYLALAVVWQQTQDGKFTPSQTPSLGPFGGRDIEAGDLDGDGRMDLVVSLFSSHTDPSIAILRQQVDGSFTLQKYLTTEKLFGVSGIALGDLNGDGRLDIVAAPRANSPTWVSVFLQSPDGNHQIETKLPTYESPFFVRVADIDNNGLADIVVLHNNWEKVGVYLQQQNGSFEPEELYSAQTGGVHAQTMSIADINNDGLLDIITVGSILHQVRTEKQKSKPQHISKIIEINLHQTKTKEPTH